MKHFIALLSVMVINCSSLMAYETAPFHASLIYEDQTPTLSLVYDNAGDMNTTPHAHPISLKLLVNKAGGSELIVESISSSVSSVIGKDMVKKGTVLEEMSRRELLLSGLYLFYSKDESQPWIPIYREERAGKMDVIQGIDFDDPSFISYMIKEGSYAISMKEYRKDQIELTEGTKQYLFANPYVIALSLDGKLGFRLKLMATNNKQQPLELSALNTQQNRLEIVGPTKQNVWSYPRYPLEQNAERKIELKVGATQAWTEDIGIYMEEKGLRRPGRYTVRWMINEKEAANFIFYLPSPEKEEIG